MGTIVVGRVAIRSECRSGGRRKCSSGTGGRRFVVAHDRRIAGIRPENATAQVPPSSAVLEAYAILRQAGGDGVACRVVLPVALRNGPLHDRADALRTRLAVSRFVDQIGSRTSMTFAVVMRSTRLRPIFRHRVVPQGSMARAAVFPVLQVDLDDRLDGLLEGVERQAR